jgi:DNA repair exonuclease SbcCD nuclease subunit
MPNFKIKKPKKEKTGMTLLPTVLNFKNKKIKKIAFFTDIHFGARTNAEMHNQDNLDYINWFCSIAKEEGADAIGFLGDWNENRSNLNIITLNYSYRGAKMLNDLGLPIFFVVGNHDLYHRHTREIHSVIPFNEFSNFKVIDRPTKVNFNDISMLFCPYMFHDEYEGLKEYKSLDVWAGHFEFKGFAITAYGTLMPKGPDPFQFVGPKRIFSGHFHKRQIDPKTRIEYIGNVFPTTFGDVNDSDRGCAVYDIENNKVKYHNWTNCPLFYKIKLSDALNGSLDFKEKGRVSCMVDVKISFEEASEIRELFLKDFELREFSYTESPELNEILEHTETEDIDIPSNITNVDSLVQEMLSNIESSMIDNELLKEIYTDLRNREE